MSDEHPQAPEPTERPRGEQPPRSAADSVTWSVRVAAAWTWRVLLLGLGAYVLIRLFFTVELVAFSLVLALLFTAVLHPLEKFLRHIPGPRSLSTLLTVLIGLAALSGVAAFVVLQIDHHSSQLATQVNDLVNQIENWLQNGPLGLKSSDLTKIGSEITTAIQEHQAALITGAIHTVHTIFEFLGALLLVVLATFFLLRDGEQIWGWVLRLFPRQSQSHLDRAGHAGWHTLGGYMRGQLTIALFHSIAITITLYILHVPLELALGVVIFLGSFVPIIGLIVAGALCSLVALLEHGLTAAIVVAVAITILVQLESHVLQPVIMSRTVEVHPLAIAVSVLTGTLLAGIVGALLAVPLVAFLNTTILALRREEALPVGESGFLVRSRKSPRGDPQDLTQPDPDDDADEFGTGAHEHGDDASDGAVRD